jgi:hypothetical protein
MHIPDSSVYEAELSRVIRAHSEEPVDLLFVEDIASWCREHKGTCSGNPIAMAIRDGSSQRAGILIRRDLKTDQVRGVQDRLLVGGFEALAEQLVTPELFLQHLALHELAHLVNDWGQEAEEDCDDWAFRAMGWLPPAG